MVLYGETTERLFSLLIRSAFEKRYLLWSTQDLANLEYRVYFTGAWKKRPKGVELCHDAANCPLVNG